MAAVRRPSATLALATAVLVFRLASAEPFFTSPGPGPGCGETGVNFVGRSAEAINEAGSLTRCRISNCDSGLKASSTAGFICLDNGLDGIDIDAVAHDCTALFNVCSGNHRHGVFVEEAVCHDVVFGNRLERNQIAGIHVWNEAVGGNTGPNVIAANICRQNGRGIGLGGRASDKTAHDNLFFNNLCADNRDRNIGDGSKHAERNYFTQSVLSGGDPAADWHQPTNVYFTAPQISARQDSPPVAGEE